MANTPYVIDVTSEIASTNLTKYDKAIEMMDLPGFEGTQSIFNPYVVFTLFDVQVNNGGKQGYNYTMHYDMRGGGIDQPRQDVSVNVPTQIATEDDRLRQERLKQDADNRALAKSHPTAHNIIKYSQNIEQALGYGPVPYSWSDFLYCKYYGKIPNNRLVTLRRYPYPTFDNVVSPNSNAMVPVAQAVTWFSEETGNKLSELLKMSFGVLWKEVEAQVQEVEGNEQAFGTGVESFLGGKAVSAMGPLLTASRGSHDLWSGHAEKQVEWARKSYTNDGPYWNQIYGPVNVVHKSHMRDRGVKYQHDITLKFHYSIKSYAGINPKVAMLDLIANFLILTYTNAKFWGGATRYFPNATFRVGFLGDQRKFYSGDYGGYAQSLGSSIQKVSKNLMAGLNKILNGDFSGLLNTITQLIGGNLSEKSQPQMLSIRSLLSGEPVGEWHLTIGNPLNPIAVIGNLIMEDATLEFGETLGADDFPTEVTFTVKLKPGKPRDKGDIESMFNQGYGRMTNAPLNALPSQQNTYGNAAGNPSDSGQLASEIEKTYSSYINKEAGYDQLAGVLNKDASFTAVQSRVKQQWGGTFSESANLTFLINSAKGRF